MVTNLARILLSRSFRPFTFTDRPAVDVEFPSTSTGIYIHVPFCRRLCPFCPYFKVVYEKEIARSYVRALIGEIRLRKQRNGKSCITSVYVGGGSPALLLPSFPSIFAEMQNCYSVSGHCGMELHPDDITERNISLLKELRFDMVSIGIQSFQREEIQSLNRTYRDYSPAIKMITQAGFSAIDIDLIFGIPGQTEVRLEKDFTTAVELGASQISTYPFIHFSYTPIRKNSMSQWQKRKLLDSLREVSRKMGYERTSIWTFARKGTPRYSSVTREAFIGHGPSAATLSSGSFSINTFSVDEYIKAIADGKCATTLTLHFTKRVRMLYWLFWSCYNLDIRNEAFQRMFGCDLNAVFSHELSLASAFGLLEMKNWGYRLTDRGAFYFHLVEQHYTHQYIDKTWRTCSYNPWPRYIKLY